MKLEGAIFDLDILPLLFALSHSSSFLLYLLFRARTIILIIKFIKLFE